MATIIAILTAVMVDHYAQFLPAGQMLLRVRSTAWLNAYLVKIISALEKMGIKQSYLILLSAILPLCIGLFILKLLCGILLGRLGTLIFITLALFYFLGYRPKAADEPQKSAFIIAHEQSFGVLFWFGVFGPTGALLYWFLVVAKQSPGMLEPENDALYKAVAWVHAMAAWIPARITGFMYALVGNFDPGFKCWKDCARNPKLASGQLLQECGKAAVGTDGEDAAEGLVNRAFFAWVVLIIFIAII